MIKVKSKYKDDEKTIKYHCEVYNCLLLYFRGLEKIISTTEVPGETAFLIPQSVLTVMAVIELTGGLLLSTGYKINFAATILAVNMIIALILGTHILPASNNLAVLAELLLIINNDGETLLEFMEPDIERLPDYKTGF